METDEFEKIFRLFLSFVVSNTLIVSLIFISDVFISQQRSDLSMVLPRSIHLKEMYCLMVQVTIRWYIREIAKKMSQQDRLWIACRSVIEPFGWMLV